MASPGKYRAKAREWAWGMSSNNNPQLAISFELLDHPGESITAYRSFTDEAFDYSLDALRTCGWKGDDFDDLTGLDRNEVVLVLENETYEGETKLKVKYINSTGGLALKTVMEPSQVKGFAAKMRDKIRAADAKAGRLPGQKPAAGETWEGRPPV